MSDTLRGLDDADAAPRGSGFDRVWALWNRRKWLGIVVFLLPFTAATAVIMALPDLYQSTALVMIERQQVPEAFVRGAGGTANADRHSTTQQRTDSVCPPP